MACLIKRPDATKGVVTFTTQERDKLIFQNRETFEKVIALKEKYVVGLHHNWHDYGFQWNKVFDFSMAGIGDLGTSQVPLVTLDACNFIPDDCFHPSNGEKHWDFIYVTRAVYFKRVELFFSTVKQIYSTGRRPKVLLICCVPPEDATPSNVTQVFMNTFTQEERKHFTFIPLEHDYPFCLDPATVGHFYRSSKVFVHFANDERRCRVVANAAATEMPIVCMHDPASIIPNELKRPPYLYIVENDDDYADKMLKALDEYDEKTDRSSIARHFRTSFTSAELKRQLKRFLGVETQEMRNESFNFNNLDIRLGRHHSISYGPNKVDMSLNKLCEFLMDNDVINQKWNCMEQDFEKRIERIESV